MTTPKPPQRLPSSPHAADPTPTAAGQDPAADQPHEWWAAYLADHGNTQLRNRLVEHYLPAVAQLAQSLARKMRFRDRENAVGDVLAALVASIVPGYDGTSGFQRWAYACAKRKLIDLRRVERRTSGIFARQPSGSRKLALLNKIPDRQPYCGQRRFGQIIAELNDRQAVVLWLRGYCGLSVKEASRVLRLSPRSVKTWTRSALAALKK